MIELASRLGGPGQLVLIGGGEFSFGETTQADVLWTGAAMAGSVGFLPTASGSTDYGEHFAVYLGEGCDREVRMIPVYRKRDARRQKNVERISDAAAVYIGGGGRGDQHGHDRPQDDRGRESRKRGRGHGRGPWAAGRAPVRRGRPEHARIIEDGRSWRQKSGRRRQRRFEIRPAIDHVDKAESLTGDDVVQFIERIVVALIVRHEHRSGTIPSEPHGKPMAARERLDRK